MKLPKPKALLGYAALIIYAVGYWYHWIVWMYAARAELSFWGWAEHATSYAFWAALWPVLLILYLLGAI